jgi:glycosyltransferase 2 family protein
MKISNKIKIALKLILVAGVLSVLIYLLHDNYKNIKNYQFTIDKIYLFFSFLFLLFAIISITIIWYLITKSFKCNLSFKRSVLVRLISEIGKYLPGRILGYGYLLIHYKNAGKERKRVLNSSFYELLLSTISAFIFFTITLIFHNYEKLSEYKHIFILISFLSIVALHPYLLQKISNFAYKLVKKESTDCRISYFKVIQFLFLYLLVWLLFGIAFFLFIRAFTPIEFDKIIYISGVFAVSTFAGFMAFFLPAGLGAREGMIILLLTVLLGIVPTIVISIGSRIWMIIGDLVLFFIAIILSRFRSKI